MGLRFRPGQNIADRRLARRARAFARRAALLLALLPFAATHGLAQTLAEQLAAKAKAAQAPAAGKPVDRLLVEATELVYEREKNVVSAQGNVRLYYQGRALQADKVIYDRNTNRVFATGNAKLTEADGTVTYSERFDLTDDFKDGFIDSLRADTRDNTHFTAARAERSDGETTVFEKGLYTACAACKNDPSRPPLWQVRAKRIIHKNSEQTVYYEDATLELYGVPIAYLPYFSSPDSTVTRKSGFLTPRYLYKSTLGVGIAVPYFWALGPDRDITFTPTVLSKQGFLGDVEWRQRLLNGSYNIRASGIFQQDKDIFFTPPYGPGDRHFRGSVESNGLFYINERWKFGWNATVSTDKWFLTDYKIVNASLASAFLGETVSSVFLNGQSGRGYFDLRGYYFRAQSKYDLQKQQPVVLPTLDYNKTFDIPPDRSAGIGGQFELDLNVTSLSRNLVAFQATGRQNLDKTYGLYDVCKIYAPGTNSGKCLLRGIGGDYTRATLNLSWKRKFIDPVGQVWTPFAFAHLNGTWLSLNTTRANNLPLANANQTAFVSGSARDLRGEAVAGAGIEYRYPFIATTSWATHVIEPIAQIIVRPNEPSSKGRVNEDAQSLVFDDTTLFEWSKYSGYDRFEGGVRANYGGQYSVNFTNGGFANIMAGQSFQVAGRNSYATPDAANVGIGSGLETRASDYVTRAVLAPDSNFSFVAKGRFDPANYALRRLDLSANADWNNISTSLQYARYAAQPAIGFDKRREGLSALAKYKFLENYYVQGNVVFDLSRYLNNTTAIRVGRFSVAALGLGLGYEDECTTFSVKYSSTYLDRARNSRTRNQSVVLELKLRTLGDARVRSNLGTTAVTDGL